MTTVNYTIEIDDSERIALDSALELLRAECDMQIANKQHAPYHSHLHSIESIQHKLATGAQQMSGNTFVTANTERQPNSDFFKARFGADGELDWLEIRALASIGAGLLTRHRGDPKAIEKLGRLAVSFDTVCHNETAKMLAILMEDAAGGPFDLTEQDWADLAKLAGYKPEVWEQLLAESRAEVSDSGDHV